MQLPPRHAVQPGKGGVGSYQRRRKRKRNKIVRTSGVRKRRKRELVMRMELQNSLCFYCGCRIYLGEHNLLPIATLDHKIPLSRGGADHLDNEVAACWGCNNAKGALTAQAFITKLLEGA